MIDFPVFFDQSDLAGIKDHDAVHPFALPLG